MIPAFKVCVVQKTEERGSVFNIRLESVGYSPIPIIHLNMYTMKKDIAETFEVGKCYELIFVPNCA